MITAGIYVTSGSNETRDVHWCITVFDQPIENDNIANQIHRFTIDYGKFILNVSICFEIDYLKLNSNYLNGTGFQR